MKSSAVNIASPGIGGLREEPWPLAITLFAQPSAPAVKIAVNLPCPCSSGLKYKRCCRLLHTGRAPESPEALMRSRYTAYVAGMVDYLISTTCADGPAAQPNRAEWAADIHAFCRGTEFEGLTVLGGEVAGDEGWVCFRAQLSQGGDDASFVELSKFVRRDNRWLYHSGQEEER